MEPEPASVAGGSFFLLGRWSVCGSKDHCEWSSLPIDLSGDQTSQPLRLPQASNGSSLGVGRRVGFKH